MSSSPIATGGAGTHFESCVAAYYLASLLIEGVVRGLSDAVAREVRLQRRFEGQPLDDIVVEGLTPTRPATLALQVKRSLAFGDNDLFNRVIAECWRTFTSQSFTPGSDRLGLAISVAPSKVGGHYQSVLNWARHSADASDFFKRIAQPGFAHDAMRDFVQTIRTGLGRASGLSIDDDTCWRFLTHFVIVHFDFEHAASSRDRLHAVERLRYALASEEADRAEALWQALVQHADQTKSAAGSADRPALIETLQGRFHLAPVRRLLPDLRRIGEAGRRALDEIKIDIGGISLNREKHARRIADAIAEADFVEIVGEPGSGKSALLRMLAEGKVTEGPVLVLKSNRLPSDPGWEGLARYWRLDNELETLIAELSCVSLPCLFIDAIDRVTDPGAWASINDLLRAISRSRGTHRWTMVVTARANNLEYRTRLDPDVMRGLVETRITIEALDDDEIAIIGAGHPRLGPLIAERGRARELARHPYLLQRLVRSKALARTDEQTPVTEIDLMIEVWTDEAGGGPALRRERQDVLLELGKRRLAARGHPCVSVGLSARALQSLVADDIIREDDVTREIDFVHDILEDWVLCQVLRHAGPDLPTLLMTAEQPLWLVDAVQLLAAWRLEGARDVTEWQRLLAMLAVEPLEPRWRRAALTAPLQSTRALELLLRIEPVLLANDAQLLAELMLAVRTVEVVPNPAFLQTDVFPDLSDGERNSLAHHVPLPRRQSWRPFLTWLVRRLPSLPAHVVDEVSRVLEVCPRAWGEMPRWAAKAVTAWAREWLEVAEADPFHRDGTARARRQSLGVEWENLDALEERLRYLILSSGRGAPAEVADYLRAAATSKRQGGAKHVIENSNLLVPHLPAELADFLLAVMVPPRKQVGRESQRSLAFNTLGIRHDDLFYAASHLRPPFLPLLRAHARIGLRLVNSLCNHAMHVWRELHRHGQRGVPLPVRIVFPWGEREFWGHVREYTWYRGYGPGPHAVHCALMALEVWMEDQVADGRDIDALFREVLEGNECVGALAACVSLALANPEKSLKAALPLIASPYLWYWDLRRTLQERGPHPNTMGLPRDWVFLRGVAERNKLPHRQRTLRDLVPYYLFFTADKDLRQAFLERIGRLTHAEPPFEFAEERTHEPAIAEIQDRLRHMRAMADPANWRFERLPDQRGTQISYQPPADLAPDVEATQEKHEAMNQVLRLALWAEKCLEHGAIQEDVSLAEAVARARELDSIALFAVGRVPDDLTASYRAGAVAGIAAVAARFATSPDTEAIGWCRDVLHRAAVTPLREDGCVVRESSIPFDPTVYAAHGLIALAERGFARAEDRELLLTLVAHPLEKVMEVIFIGLSRVWDREPVFCWQAVVLGMRLSLMPWAFLPRSPGVVRDDTEAVCVESVLTEVLQDLRTGRTSTLPAIPLPWEAESSHDPGQASGGGWQRSEIAFLWDMAPHVLFHQPLEYLLGTQARRQPILRLVAELIAWTIQECDPPWAGNRTDHTPPFEWVNRFMRWCGRLSQHLSNEEVLEIIVRPVCEAQEETGLLLMARFLDGFVHHRFSQAEVPSAVTVALWRELCDWVFSHREWRRVADRDFLNRDFSECVSLTLFCSYGRCLLEHPWSGLSACLETIRRWVDTFGAHPVAYNTLAGFLEQAGSPLLPSPALRWLAEILETRKGDQQFWNLYDNGGKTAALLDRVLTQHSETIAGDPDLTKLLIRMTDLLIAKGVRLAAQVQQRLAEMTR